MSPVSGHQPRSRGQGRTLRRTYLPIVIGVVVLFVVAALWLLGAGS